MGSAVSRTDSGFGPILEGKGYFTLLFEESIFTTAPAGIAILAAIIQVASVIRKPMLVRVGAIVAVKAILGISLFGCHLATLVLWASMPSGQTDLTLPSAGLAVAGSFSIFLFLLLEHFYSYRLSSFLGLFMSVTLLLDIAKAYSCFYRIGLGPLCSMYILGSVLRFLLLLSQEVSKRQLIRLESLRSSVGREASSGFWTRSLFLWLNSTLLLGFRQAFKVEDLPFLALDFRSKTSYETFKPQWDRVDKQSRFALLKACVLAQAIPFVTVVIPRLCLIGFTFAQPFLLLRTTRAVEEDDLPSTTTDGIVGATALIYFGIAVSKGYSTHLAYQVTTCMRGMITVAIYDKMFHVSHEALAESAAVTHMSTDLAGLERLVPLFHDVWAAIVELALGFVILGKIAGPSCVLFFVPGVITTAGTSIVTERMMHARTAWNEKIQERIAKTSNVIAQLKVIKMAGLSKPMLGYIERLRAVELETSMRERNLRVILGGGLNAFNRALAPVIVVAGALFWTRAGDGLTPNEIYTILAVVSIVSQPLATMLLAAPSLSGSLASFPRIQKFLCQDELVDARDVDDRHTSVTAANVSINSEISRTLLQDVDLDIAAGDVAMLTGPVGCGKTVLLKALIGEVQPSSGSIQVTSSPIGYSDQVAWLENTTIQENICHGNYNATRYKQAIAACALEPDLEALPLGDKTIVGTNGFTLSGGQRQRVALCRAVYCEADLVVLDDPLSSVDATTSSAVVQRLLGENGLLRKRNTTVLMATSSPDLCSVADSVFTINGEGQVSRVQNSSREIKVDRTSREFQNEQKNEEQHTGEKANAPDPAPTVTVPTSPPKPEQSELRKGDRTLYAYYLGSVKRPLLFLSLCLITISSLSDRTPVVFLRIWLDIDPGNNLYFIGYAALGVSKIVFSSLSWYLFFRNVFMSTSKALHTRLSAATVGATLSFLSETDAGSIVSRFSQDMTLVAQDLPILFLNTFYSTVTILIETAIISAGAKFVATAIPGLLMAIYLLQCFYLRTSRQLRIQELETNAPLFTQFLETARGMQHIRAFKWQEAFTLHMQELLDYSLIPYYNLFCVQRWLTLVLDLIVGSLGSLLESWVELEICLGAIARIKNFCLGTPQEKDGESDGSIPDSWPSTGRIEFRNVSAGYRALDGNYHQTLNNVSFTIGGGQNCGLSGRTGSGKSTLLAVLLRMTDYSGSILVDGRELRSVPHEIVRSRFITVAQDGLQLQGSIRLNLDPYNSIDANNENQASDARLIQALTQVGLWESIQLCGGLDSDISAASLSKGQLQLFGIARAILEKTQATTSSIALLDEVTSSVDGHTDRKIHAVIAEVFANSTVFMVSHRLYAFDGMSKVIKLSNGQVEGTLERDPDSGLLVEAS